MRRSSYRLALACVCAGLVACNKQQPGPSELTRSGPITIERLDPNFTAQGKAFNVQPDGQAALAIVGADIPVGSVLLWNDQPLKTNGGGSRGWASAAVPASLYASAGIAKLAIRSPDGAAVSNTLDFTVYPLAGPAPGILELYPRGAVANQGFNLQPGGSSAIGVRGTGFLPGARIFFGGKEMRTSFTSVTNLTAAVPTELVTRAGKLEVWVVNPDGKTSTNWVFQITKE